MKDLIISGDVSLQNALDKLAERRDSSDLIAICKSLMHRRGSIDLLENMDLDLAFLGADGSDKDDDFFSTVGGDFNDDEGESGISINIDAIRHIRRASIDSNSGFRNFDDLMSNSNKSGAASSGVHARSSSITSSAGMFGGHHQDDALLQTFHTNIFDVHGQVELSAYESMAKSLSATKPLHKPNNFQSQHNINTATNRRISPAPERLMKSELSRSSSAPAGGSYNGASHRSLGSMNESHATAMSLTMAMMSSAPTLASTGGNLQTQAAGAVASMTAIGGIIGGLPEGLTTMIQNAEGQDTSALPSGDFSHLAWLKRVDASDGKLYIGAYSPEQRRKRIERFIEKRSRRVWTKKVKYDVRKNFADSRLRVKGRFVKKEDEEIMRELMTF
jgi:hypothetical protein